MGEGGCGVILPKQELMHLTGLSDSFDLDFAHRGVEQEIKNYCGWELESATYTNIVVDGSGDQWIWPGHKNITKLTRASTGVRPAINIKHSTASSNAYASVNYTSNAAVSLGLDVADGTDVSSTSDLFSTYTTMTLLVAQIASNGWSAELYDSDYGIFATTNLLEVDALSAGTEDGTDPGWSELKMPGAAVSGVKVERTEGGLYLSSCWPDGIQNVALTYTAGWTTANMPSDLKQAVAQFTSYFYNQQQQGGTGIKSFSLRNLRIEYNTSSTANGGKSSIPMDVLDVLDRRYRIKVIV
jgi:hypothetical protein